MEGAEGTNDGSMTLPIYTYSHSSITGAGFGPNGPAIIGGVIFRANPASKYYGTYFIADWGSKGFWNLTRDAGGVVTATALAASPTSISSFGTDASGRIYACGYATRTIYLLDSPDLVPSSTIRPGKPRAVGPGRTFTANPGGRLEARAFASSPVLEVFGLDGKRMGAVREEDTRLPANLRPGLYLLQDADGQGAPGLLALR